MNICLQLLQLCIVICFMCFKFVISSNNDHLVVLSHGLHGNRNDLAFLAEKLKKKGCTVLMSSASEYLESHNGVKEGGTRLASEVLELQSTSPHLSRISFVGNSLGGLYSRYAIKILYEHSMGTIGRLTPHYFMTIASPHLGVRNHTLFEEYKLDFVPSFVMDSIAGVLGQSGLDLYVHDPNHFEEASLLYEMSTKSEYLQALRVFKQRRLYANLDNDLMVPLGTAAFMTKAQVQELRKEHLHIRGIVQIIQSHPILTTSKEEEDNSCIENEQMSTCTSNTHSKEQLLEQQQQQKLTEEISSVTNSIPTTAIDRMRQGLDNCGWEKIIVNFPALYGILPMAHNQIAAVSKFGTVVDGMLGFHDGRFLMASAADWMTSTYGP